MNDFRKRSLSVTSKSVIDYFIFFVSEKNLGHFLEILEPQVQSYHKGKVPSHLPLSSLLALGQDRLVQCDHVCISFTHFTSILGR